MHRQILKALNIDYKFTKVTPKFVRETVQVIMAALAPEIKQRVKEFWADRKARSSGERISTRALFREYRQKVSNNEIGLSKFNTIVRDLERAGPSDPFPCSEWKPWTNPDEGAEDSAFLLRISAVMQAEIGRGLYNHEAKWGQRLRVALEGLHPFGQYRLVLHYSIRKVAAYYLKEEPYTTDLDHLVAYKPWLPENQRAYHLAVLSGSAHYPNLDPFNNLVDPPPPEEVLEFLKEQVRLSGAIWWVQMFWTLRPWGTNVPDKKENPERAWMLDQLLQFWAGIQETDESTQEEGVTDERVNQATQ